MDADGTSRQGLSRPAAFVAWFGRGAGRSAPLRFRAGVYMARRGRPRSESPLAGALEGRLEFGAPHVDCRGVRTLPRGAPGDAAGWIGAARPPAPPSGRARPSRAPWSLWRRGVRQRSVPPPSPCAPRSVDRADSTGVLALPLTGYLLRLRLARPPFRAGQRQDGERPAARAQLGARDRTGIRDSGDLRRFPRRRAGGTP